jgi:hypothetical protein
MGNAQGSKPESKSTNGKATTTTTPTTAVRKKKQQQPKPSNQQQLIEQVRKCIYSVVTYCVRSGVSVFVFDVSRVCTFVFWLVSIVFSFVCLFV